MTYIILRDTFGDGLETISNIGVDVIEKHQLDEYICAAAQSIIDEDGWDGLEGYNGDEETIPMGETLVICEILGELKGKSVDTYINDLLEEREKQSNTEEYELYLKLKEKFEK